MAAIGQERIEIGTNLRLRLAPTSPGTDKKLPETDTIDKRNTLANTGKLVAFASDCTVTFNSTLTDTNNKDSGVFQSSIPTLLGADVEASFMQPQWAAGQTPEAAVDRLNVVDWIDVFLKRQYLWVTYGAATYVDAATDPVHAGNVVRFWALLSSLPFTQPSHEVATTSVSLQSTGIIYRDSI